MSEEKKGIFDGFTAKDWIIGLFTGWLWVLYKMHKNGVPIGKVLGGVIIVLGLIVFENSTDSGKASSLEYALKNNQLEKAKNILSENPQITTENGLTASEVVQKIKNNLKAEAEAERLAKEKAEAERIAEEKAAKEKAERIAKEKAERIAKERAERTIVVSRDELGRVLNRPSKYLGKIIKFKDKVDWDYVVQFSTMDSDKSNLKTLNIYSIEMKGANWSEISQPYLFIPKDINDKMDDDFYNKTGKNMGDYKMQTNEMELLPMSGSDFNRIFGSSNRYVGNEDSVVVITNIKIYTRDLGTYQTKLINY